jgi:membrane fusion protein (multidrug efflux system)
MTKRLIIVLLALGLVLGGIFGWKYYQAQRTAAQAATPPPPATVAAAEVQAEDWQPYLYTVGSLVAVQGIFVTTEIQGQVKKILFDSGQQVTEGTLLVQLDDSIDQAELKGLIAERQRAEIRFKRIARLYKQGSVSGEDYDEARLEFEAAAARVAAKQALIDKKKIHAPFNGLLGIRQADLGEYLAPGAKIVPLETIDPIYVDFSLPERHFSELAEGQQLELTVQAYPGQTFQGEITAINPGIDQNTRNVQVRAELANPNGRLRPGMFAEVRVLLPERENLLTVPRTAITYNPYGDSVFVIEQQNNDLVVQRRPVETGNTRDGKVEIIKGLKAGERVVRAGQVKLRNDQRVKIDNSVTLDEGVAGL